MIKVFFSVNFILLVFFFVSLNSFKFHCEIWFVCFCVVYGKNNPSHTLHLTKEPKFKFFLCCPVKFDSFTIVQFEIGLFREMQCVASVNFRFLQQKRKTKWYFSDKLRINVRWTEEVSWKKKLHFLISDNNVFGGSFIKRPIDTLSSNDNTTYCSYTLQREKPNPNFSVVLFDK